MDSYQKLADAVIILATRDYKGNLKKLKKNPTSKEAMNNAMECERFFYSQWFAQLTTIEGSYLVDRLRQEVAMT